MAAARSSANQAARSSANQAAWTWSAVLAGVITSLIIQVILATLGIGIGLVATDVPTASNAPFTLSGAAALWWTASGIFAAFVGGAIAGAYAPVRRVHSRIAHALAAWAIAVLIVVGAASFSAGGILSNLYGPTATASTRLQSLTRPQAASQPTQAQLETARKAVAAAMFASFIALLLGGGAAFLGGWWSEELADEFD